MAISQAHITVDGTPVELVGPSTSHVRLVVSNYGRGQAKKLFVGGPDVTVANGLEVLEYPLQLELNPNESLYGVCESGTTVVAGVLRQG
jgi:hypothetical protein